MSLRRTSCLINFLKISSPHCVRELSKVQPKYSKAVCENIGIVQRSFVPLRTVSVSDLGYSILTDASKNRSLKDGGMLPPKLVLAAKVLSLSSSAISLAMIPVMSQILTQKPGTGTIAAVLDSFFILYAFTPILLHQILVKRYIVDLFYNPETEIFTSVHFGFFLGKNALRFRAEDVVDSNYSPDMLKLWFPLATAVIHGKPLMLCLNEKIYNDDLIFRKLTQNIKFTS